MLAISLTGGGARAAYQAGVLRGLCRHFPDLGCGVLTGVSAGAINATYLAATEGRLPERVEALADTWSRLRIDDVFEARALPLMENAVRWLAQLGSGGRLPAPRLQGLVDTKPLWGFLRRQVEIGPDDELPAIARNLDSGQLRAVSVSTLSYTTGLTTTWVEGRSVEPWRRPGRRAVVGPLRLPHVMASAALPLLFPAVEVDGQWHGDGGVRLAAPLSPAIHLGADRVLAISPRRPRSSEEEEEAVVAGYPPPAQVLGMLVNSIFLDLVDQDLLRLERLNKLLARVPAEHRLGMRHVRLLVIRPSRDLGRMANDYEPELPRAFRFLTRGLGTQRTRSNDLLSLLMFQPDYLSQLIAIGERDAEERVEEVREFLTH